MRRARMVWTVRFGRHSLERLVLSAALVDRGAIAYWRCVLSSISYRLGTCVWSCWLAGDP
jgi:hypothetical protein